MTRNQERLFAWSEASLFGVQMNACGINRLPKGHRYRYNGGRPLPGISFIRRGRATVTFRKNRFAIKAGDLLYSPPSADWKLEADNDQPWEEYWLIFIGGPLTAQSQDLPSDFSVLQKAGKCGTELARLCAVALSRETPPAQLAARLVSFLATLPSRFPRSNKERFLDPVGEAVGAIRKNPGLDFDFKSQAVRSGLSYSLFRRRFKTMTGISPHQFLNITRIHASLSHLIAGRAVKSVAAEMGMSDPYHFSRLFKQRMGESPEAYRARKRLSQKPRTANSR